MIAPPPGYGPPPAPPGRHRWWLVAVSVVWLLVVGAAAVWAVRHGRPTAREQTTIGRALPTLDEAVARSVTAAGTDRVVIVLGGYEQLSADCRVTAARSGAQYARSVLLFTPVGSEHALLQRIADGLPAGYQAEVGSTLHADPGNFVRMRGLVVAPGQLRITADTGCRPQDRPVAEPELSVPAMPTAPGTPVPGTPAVPGSPGAGPGGSATPGTSGSADPRTGDVAAGRSTAAAVLDTLEVPDVEWRAHQLACPGGGLLWTIEASGVRTGQRRPLSDVLTARAVLVTDQAYAYRATGVEVVVQVKDGVATVDATGGCGRG